MFYQETDFYALTQLLGVRAARLVAAHRSAVRDEYQGTDDASLVERLGGRVAEQLQNSEVTVTRRRPGDKGGAARQAQQAAGAADAAPEKSGSARRRRRRRPGDKGGQRGASGADQSGSAE